MNPIASMTADQLREHVRTVAHMLATRSHRDANPGATADDAETFAARHWRTFRAAAVDFIALAEADREAAAAAPNN